MSNKFTQCWGTSKFFLSFFSNYRKRLLRPPLCTSGKPMAHKMRSPRNDLLFLNNLCFSFGSHPISFFIASSLRAKRSNPYLPTQKLFNPHCEQSKSGQHPVLPAEAFLDGRSFSVGRSEGWHHTTFFHPSP